jgi:DNA-binding NarL/FixJ family response regulator
VQFRRKWRIIRLVTRVLVAARDRLIVDAIVDWFAEEPTLVASGETTLADATVAALRDRPDVVLVGLDLPGDLPGFVRRVCGAVAGVRVGLLADTADTATVLGCLHEGATAVIDRTAPLGVLAQSVRAVAGGAVIVPPDLVPWLLDVLRTVELPPDEWQLRVQRLTARELEVLRWLMSGATRAVIARELYLSVNTVRTHVGRVFEKLDAHSALEAIAIGRRAGLEPAIPRAPHTIGPTIPERRRRTRDDPDPRR